MSVQSLGFLPFLAAAVLVCTAVPIRVGRLLLTAFSVAFCLAGGPAGIVVLAAGTVVTALALRAGRRKAALVMACVWHIAVLAAFKYLPIGWMPLGLSFFTFQQLWLLKERWTGAYTPQKGDSLALYAFFFPTVTSGPILRPGAFFPQLRGETFLRPGERDIAAGLYALCLGYGKKLLLADPLGVVVANGWAAVTDLTAPAAWVTMTAYTLQLYLDFSGYCDIAAGCARLLGVRLPVNFDSPYRSLSVGEFWKRWHITLTTFLRECLYFPLGGSRKGRGRACLNILIVFLVSGLWHGSGWTFVVWGLLHGLAQVMERLWGPGRDRLPRALRWAMTMAFVQFAWVFFRAPDMAGAGALFASALTGGGTVGVAALSVGVLESEVNVVTTLLPRLTDAVALLLPALLLAAGGVVSLWPRNTIRSMEDFRPTLRSALALAVLTVWAVLSFSGVTTFIYSNF